MHDVPERAPIANAALSVILLVHDDGAELEHVVTAWLALLKVREQPFEIILVDDGSTDGSAVLADQLAERFPHLHVAHHASFQGEGAALRTGLAQAGHPLVFHAPANKQFQPPDLTQLLGMIDQVDLATGFRVFRPMPLWLRTWDFLTRWFCRIVFGLPIEPRPGWLGSDGFATRFVARWIFGVQLHDPECPYRLFRREVLRRIPIQSASSFAHVEVLAKANFLGALMAEVPISFVPRKMVATDWNEMHELFLRPDFGPTILPPESAPPAAEIPPLPESAIVLPPEGAAPADATDAPNL